MEYIFFTPAARTVHACLNFDLRSRRCLIISVCFHLEIIIWTLLNTHWSGDKTFSKINSDKIYRYHKYNIAFSNLIFSSKKLLSAISLKFFVFLSF